jgi:single-strand DNA-binding protein
MASLNSCSFIGNVGHTPKVKTLDSGRTVASFSIAVNSKRGDKETTLWINVSAWEKLAEVAGTYIKSGQQVFVQGEISVRTYKNDDGEVKASTELTARQLVLLGKKDENGGSGPVAQGSANKAGGTEDDDLDF